MFVKKGDKVRVIAGKDKGTEAVVLTASIWPGCAIIRSSVPQPRSTKGLTMR